MKRITRRITGCILTLLLAASLAPAALAGGMENEEYLMYYLPTQEAWGNTATWETVERVVLLSRTGDYTLTGKDAAADGTVTMVLGNTYDFVLEKTANGYLEGTGIALRARDNAQYLPLDNAGTYAVLDYNTPIYERVEFTGVSLNEKVLQPDLYGGEGPERGPCFGINGHVVCTLTFQVSSVYHHGDGDLSYEDEENHYDIMAQAQPLPQPINVTYTITIDGSSNGVYSEYSLEDSTTLLSGVGYTSSLSGVGGTPAVYTLDMDIDGQQTHYDLTDPAEPIRWLSVDIKFDISQWAMKEMVNEHPVAQPGEKRYEEQPGAYDREEPALYHTSGLTRGLRATVLSLCAGGLGLVLTALSGTAGAMGGMAEESVQLPQEDTPSVTVTVDPGFSDLLNEPGSAVVIPVEVSGPEGLRWHYLAAAVSQEAPHAVVASTAGAQALLTLTGEMNGLREADVTLFVTAWAKGRDGTIWKGTTAAEFVLHTPGITACREDGVLQVTRYSPSHIPGVADVTELGEADYILENSVITDRGTPEFSCEMP